MDIRILIIAPDPLVRVGLATVIERQPGCIIAGQVGNIEDVPALINLYHPDVGLLDLGIAVEDPQTAFDIDIPLPLVVLCPLSFFSNAILFQQVKDNDGEGQPAWANRRGRGFLNREAAVLTIFHAFYSVLDGMVVVDPSIMMQVPARGEEGVTIETLNSFPLASDQVITPIMDQGSDAQMPNHDSRIYEKLTPRELEVLALIAEGLPNKKIAQKLEISEHTIKFHVNAIIGKLGVESRTEAVTRAARLGILRL